MEKENRETLYSQLVITLLAKSHFDVYSHKGYAASDDANLDIVRVLIKKWA